MRIWTRVCFAITSIFTVSFFPYTLRYRTLTYANEDIHSIITSQEEDACTEKCALLTSNHFSELRRRVLEENTHLTDKVGVGKIYNHKCINICCNKYTMQ